MTGIVLLGAPGSGKGTQAQRLQARFAIPQVSSGDLLRDAVARGTDLGLKAKAAMETGQLVSDEIVLGLIRERLARPDARRGFILDGFPRNADQAEALEVLLGDMGQALDVVVLLDVSHELLNKRLTGRRTCRACGRVFNVHFSPPGTPPHCDRCDDKPELFQRPDDREDVIEKRLEVYEAQTRPLIEHYARKGLLQVVKGEGPLENVFDRMQSVLLGAGATVPVEQSAVRGAAGHRKPTAPARKSRAAAARRRPKAAKARSSSRPASSATRRGSGKAPAKQPSTRQAGTRKPAAKKAGRKAAASKKTASRKAVAASTARKTAGRKTATGRKKVAAKKRSVSKAAAGKSGSGRTATKRTLARGKLSARGRAAAKRAPRKTSGTARKPVTRSNAAKKKVTRSKAAKKK